MDSLTYAIEPGLLYGRPGPNKSRWNLPDLKQKGIAVIVSLVKIERPEEITRLGFKHYVIPFEEKVRLPYKTANQFIFDVLDVFDRALDTHLPRSEPMLVHCNRGRDRTGLLMVYYLMTRKGMTAKKALKAVRRQKSDALLASGFEELLFALEPEIIKRRKQISRPS